MENRNYPLHKITGILALIGAAAKIISVLVGGQHANYTPPPLEVQRPGPMTERQKIDEEKRREFFKFLAETQKQFSDVGPSNHQDPDQSKHR